MTIFCGLLSSVAVLAGVLTEEQAREALRLASHKLPVKCKIIKKEEF